MSLQTLCLSALIGWWSAILTDTTPKCMISMQQNAAVIITPITNLSAISESMLLRSTKIGQNAELGIQVILQPRCNIALPINLICIVVVLNR